MRSGHEELDAIRGQIEEVDRELLHLIAERIELARRAGAVKRSFHDPIIDPPQESEVIGRALQWAHEHGLDPRGVQAIVEQLIAMSRAVQGE